MADLNKLLSSSADELKALLIPVGTWHGVAKAAKIDKADDAKTDKNGRDYVRAMIAVTLTEPFPDVDATEASALNGELADEPVFYSTNIYGSRDAVKFRNILKALGAQDTGRTLEEMAAEVKELDCVVEIEHEKYEGEDQNRVRKIYAPDAS